MTDVDALKAARRTAPSALRNREPIADLLEKILPPAGTVLEIASGTGEHALYFARRFPQILWQPSDIDPAAIASIKGWACDADLPNLLMPPLVLDAARPGDWPDLDVAAILSINMVHISPWSAAEGLFANAARYLDPGEPLVLYGPYIRADRETAPSNLAFDADLKARNPAWGLRTLEALDALAAASGLARADCFDMPANNMMLVYRRV